MVRLLSLTRATTDSDSPREITPTHLPSETGENGWLIRFFDSAFFCEWIAVSYLYKHDHPGVRDYLCNRMYTLPLSGVESYLFQICYMLVHKPSPSLDKFVIDMCTKSLQIALKVHWFLMAELEDVDDNEGISRIQEKCQIAATLMGDWPPLIRPKPVAQSPGSKNQVLNKLLSSKQRLLSLGLTSSGSNLLTQRSASFSPSSGSGATEEVVGNGNGKAGSSPEENKIFKKLLPGPKVRDALMFRKSVEKDKEKDRDKDDEEEKDGFFKRLLRDKDDEEEKDGFFKRLLRDSKDEDDELMSSSEGFFKRLFRDSKNDSDEKVGSKSAEFEEKDGFFKRLLRDSKDEDEVLTSSSDGFFKRLLSRDAKESEEKIGPRSTEEEDEVLTSSSDGFFKRLLSRDAKESDKKVGPRVAEDDEKEGFFRKLFKEKFEDKKDGNDRGNDEDKGIANGDDEEPSDFFLFRRLFRVHPEEEAKPTVASENGNSGGAFESSPGTEKFFRKLFRDRDRSVEDSELFGSKKQKETLPGSPRQRNDKNAKPPLPNSVTSQIRKGAYHVSLDFVQSLCDTSYGLVDIFPIEDRKSALCESLMEINTHIAAAESSGGVCFPMGKGMYRVVHIPEDEAVLLNSREKAPYMICVEVLKGEMPSHTKDASTVQKLSRGGIPLANGDVQLPKPPPWAYPLWSSHDVQCNGTDRMLRSTSQAIDQAMAHSWEAKLNSVHVSLSLEMHLPNQPRTSEMPYSSCSLQEGSLPSAPVAMREPLDNGKDAQRPVLRTQQDNDLEWVRVVLTADPGVSMEDVEDQQEPHRRKEHRRVPSTVAIEEVKAAAAKGTAPLGLPLKGAGQDSSDAKPKILDGGVPKATDALSGELWEARKERICSASVFGKSSGWDLRSVIVKSGDDCRQEHLAVQLVSHFYDIFQEAGLPLWLRPYEVLVTSSYTALIETIPDTASIHSIKSRFPSITSLREFFIAKYEENSQSFKLAQRNFVESMAGYSILCYFLQVKDRHNGNLLMDEEGHIIHIDFGFMLSNSPGGVNFESAPFKLTRELLEVMDSDAEGLPSEFFDYYKVLCIQGFLTCRKHAERIILLVEMMQDSGYPCFKGGPRTIQNLRKRFHLSLTEEQCVSVVLSLISSSLDAWRTRQYDYYQRVLNGIL